MTLIPCDETPVNKRAFKYDSTLENFLMLNIKRAIIHTEAVEVKLNRLSVML